MPPSLCNTLFQLRLIPSETTGEMMGDSTAEKDQSRSKNIKRSNSIAYKQMLHCTKITCKVTKVTSSTTGDPLNVNRCCTVHLKTTCEVIKVTSSSTGEHNATNNSFTPSQTILIMDFRLDAQ